MNRNLWGSTGHDATISSAHACPQRGQISHAHQGLRSQPANGSRQHLPGGSARPIPGHRGNGCASAAGWTESTGSADATSSRAMCLRVTDLGASRETKLAGLSTSLRSRRCPWLGSSANHRGGNPESIRATGRTPTQPPQSYGGGRCGLLRCGVPEARSTDLLSRGVWRLRDFEFKNLEEMLLSRGFLGPRDRGNSSDLFWGVQSPQRACGRPTSLSDLFKGGLFP